MFKLTLKILILVSTVALLNGSSCVEDPAEDVDEPDCPVLMLTTPSTTLGGHLESPLTVSFTTEGGEGGLSFIISDGELPPGLAINGDTGEITGTPTQEGTFTCEVTVNDECEVVQSDSITLVITIGPPPVNEIPLGVYACDVESPEGIYLCDDVNLGWITTPCVTVSGANGTALCSLSDPVGSTLYDGFMVSGTQQWGACAVASEGVQDRAYHRAIFRFGPTGTASSAWYDVDDDFGWTQLGAMGLNVTDALPYDNLIGSGGFCYVNNSLGSVGFLEYDQEQEIFLEIGQLNYYAFPGASNNAVSAFTRGGGGVLVINDGTPGVIHVHDRVDLFSPATLIGEVGDSPRRIRCAGEVAVVSNFGSDNLSIFTWDSGNTVVAAGTIPVGDGPIGIDLLELDGGDIAVVSTGFHDDSYWVTVLDSSGGLVSNTGFDMPTGCAAPGHAIWLHDDHNRIMVSGNSSGNQAVVASGL